MTLDELCAEGAKWRDQKVSHKGKVLGYVDDVYLQNPTDTRATLVVKCLPEYRTSTTKIYADEVERVGGLPLESDMVSLDIDQMVDREIVIRDPDRDRNVIAVVCECDTVSDFEHEVIKRVKKLGRMEKLLQVAANCLEVQVRASNLDTQEFENDGARVAHEQDCQSALDEIRALLKFD